MSGAFEQYRKSGTLATLSHRSMLENCSLTHARQARCETLALSTEEMSTCGVGRCAFLSACVS